MYDAMMYVHVLHVHIYVLKHEKMSFTLLGHVPEYTCRTPPNVVLRHVLHVSEHENMSLTLLGHKYYRNYHVLCWEVMSQNIHVGHIPIQCWDLSCMFQNVRTCR